MYTIRARNVNEAYPLALQLIAEYGIRVPSRVGDVLMLREPLAIRYRYPHERVLFDTHRDANPFFHFMESLWMLGGRNDVKWLAQWLPRMKDFSDDKQIFHGAYGFRWRHNWNFDQLKAIIFLLAHEPTTRLAVLTMWDPSRDLGSSSLDIPCNLNIKFEIVSDRLNMTVFNRSNDLILGALGANVVHFSMLQQFIAESLNVHIGWYEQVSANAHVYEAEWIRRGYHHGVDAPVPGFYELKYSGDDLCERGPNILGPNLTSQVFLTELGYFLQNPGADDLESELLNDVALPLVLAHQYYRQGQIDAAVSELAYCKALDWKEACTAWLRRRTLAGTL